MCRPNIWTKISRYAAMATGRLRIFTIQERFNRLIFRHAVSDLFNAREIFRVEHVEINRLGRRRRAIVVGPPDSRSVTARFRCADSRSRFASSTVTFARL
jgi:hypothetical protein